MVSEVVEETEAATDAAVTLAVDDPEPEERSEAVLSNPGAVGGVGEAKPCQPEGGSDKATEETKVDSSEV